MAKEFSKAGRQITIAVKQSGPDPDANIELRRAIQNAKSVQMPKDRIDAAIKKASSRDTSAFDQITYEGMAPYGVAVIVETATDNPTRTVANVRASFSKKGGSLGTQGMHSYLFDKNGVFTLSDDQVEDVEMLELDLIDFGLESIEFDEATKQYRIITAFQDFGNMQVALEARNMKAEKSEVEWIAKMTKELSDEQVDEVLELIDRLEQDDDVQNVYHNLA
jgi:YebC/PmpR family DNA-binding regulatory protein